MNILVVDDSRVIRNIIANILKEKNSSGNNFFEAGDGAEALVLAKKEKIDVFFLDWNMPKMSGLELTQELRKLDQYKTIPIIMVTSEAAKYNVLEAVKAGVTEYVIKPITAKTILEKAGKYL